MMSVLHSSQRGHENFGWLDSHHSFSFGEYFDPEKLGFRDLKAINDDRIAGGNGFPPHSHANIEIITYVIRGALQHKDTLGNSTIVREGELQILSAGTGVRQSEANALVDQDTHIIQFWINPRKKNHKPHYIHKSFSEEFETKSLVLVASPDGEDGSLLIHQDVWMHVGELRTGEERRVGLKKGRHAWVQVIRGDMTINGTKLSECDGFAVSNETELHIKSTQDSDFILLDMV